MESLAYAAGWQPGYDLPVPDNKGGATLLGRRGGALAANARSPQPQAPEDGRVVVPVEEDGEDDKIGAKAAAQATVSLETNGRNNAFRQAVMSASRRPDASSWMRPCRCVRVLSKNCLGCGVGTETVFAPAVLPWQALNLQHHRHHMHCKSAEPS